MKIAAIGIGLLVAMGWAMEPTWPRPIQLPVQLAGDTYLEDCYSNADYTFVVIRLEGQGTGSSPFAALRPLLFQIESENGTITLEHLQELPGELRGTGHLVHRVRLRFAGHGQGMLKLLISFYKNPDDFTEVDLGPAGEDWRPWAEAITNTKGFPLKGGFINQFINEKQMPLAQGDKVLVFDRDKGLWQEANGKWVNVEVLWVISPDGRVMAVPKQDLKPAANQPEAGKWEAVGLMVQAFDLDSGAPIGDGWRKGTQFTDMGETKEYQGGNWVKVRDANGLDGFIYAGSVTEPAIVQR